MTKFIFDHLIPATVIALLPLGFYFGSYLFLDWLATILSVAPNWKTGIIFLILLFEIFISTPAWILAFAVLCAGTKD